MIVGNIIVIRIPDPDGDIFQSIIEAIQNENIQPTSISQFEFPVINIGEIKIFPAQRRVVKAGKQIHLNYGEFSMLCCMAKSPGQVFSREQLYASAWGESYNWSSNTVDNTIWRLRKNLNQIPKNLSILKLFSDWAIKLNSHSCHKNQKRLKSGFFLYFYIF